MKKQTTKNPVYPARFLNVAPAKNINFITSKQFNYANNSRLYGKMKSTDCQILAEFDILLSIWEPNNIGSMVTILSGP